MIEINVTLIIILNVLLLTTLFGFFLYLIIQKIIDNKKALRKNELKQMLQPAIFSYLENGTELHIPRAMKGEILYEVIAELLDNYIQVSSSKEVKARVVTVSTKYLNSYINQMLDHRRWSFRMNALYRIEDFRLVQFEQELWQTFQSNIAVVEEQYQLIRALAALQSPHLLNYLKNGKHNYPFFLYKEMLRRYDENGFAQIVAYFSLLSPELKAATIEIMGEKRDIGFVSLLEKHLHDNNLEIRLKVLKALTQIGVITNFHSMDCFVTSPHFQERFLFTKLAAVVKKEEFKRKLVQLLSDENWWVRNGAGEALTTFEDGLLILSYVLENHEDQFARDMAKQWVKGELI